MIRYSKKELISWQEACEGEEGQWESICATFPRELLCSVQPTSAHHRRRNVDSRQRTQPFSNTPVFFQPAECLDTEMCDLNGSPDSCEEEDADAFDDSDDEVSLQPLAFLVDGEPDFESGPPQDGFEYLRRVMWETAQCPKVKIAKIGEKKLISEQTNYMPTIPPIPTCSPNLLPSKEWVQAFLKDFSELRAVLSNSSAPHEDGLEDLPSIRNKSVWKSVCFGRSRSTDPCDEQEDSNTTCEPTDALPKETVSDDIAHSPCLKVLLRLDEISRATLFRYHVLWLNEQSQLTYDRAMWLFALAAAVDSLLDDQTSAAFRDMLRKCAELRVRKTAVDEELYMINILMTIAGEYFGQAEDSGIISV
eukprot:c23475_g1_i2 orf=236-1324(-)